MTDYVATIGLEIHAQLLTKSKMFCRCPNRYGDAPNTNICPICLGYPGTLPVPNEKALEFALRLGFATESTIEEKAYFARKNYFYPDLSKGYQITQYAEPICRDGHLLIKPENEDEHYINIQRIHLEEDTGKNFHPETIGDTNLSYIDYNRCGVPLIEIVTQPELHSGAEVYYFLTRLRQLIRFLGISTGDMDKGAMRCDVNIDVKKKGDKPGIVVEIKNLNSFSSARKAIEFEIQRHKTAYEKGLKIKKETRTWDERAGITKLLRTKEQVEDYRYFLEPDLIPVQVPPELLQQVKSTLPELPWEMEKRFIIDYGLRKYDAGQLVSNKALALFYCEAEKFTKYKQEIANWILRDYLGVLKENNLSIANYKIPPQNVAELVNLVKDGSIAAATAKDVFSEMARTGKKASKIVESKGLQQLNDDNELLNLVKQVVEGNPKQKVQFLAGKDVIFKFFIGQVMKVTKGKANPKKVREMLNSYLTKLK